MLKKDNNINNDKIIICEFSLTIFDRSFAGKKPPDDIIVKAKLRESKVLIEKIFRIIKIKRVKDEYNKNIFVVCFKISELLNEIKLVSVFLKLSS